MNQWKTYQNKPIHVDVQKIAQGLYDMMDEDEKAIICFGMIPEAKLSICRKELQKKSTQFWPYATQEEMNAVWKDFDITGIEDMLENGRIKTNQEHEQKRKNWVAELEHKICLALYSIAPMVV